MAKHKPSYQYLPDGTLDTTNWLTALQSVNQIENTTLLEKTLAFTSTLTSGRTTFYGQPCLEHGLNVADILFNLKLDQETASAGILYSAARTHLPQADVIEKALGATVTKLVINAQQMDMLPTFQKQLQSRNNIQIDKIRKMLLGMATDIRVVIIKLAERLSFLYGIKNLPDEEKKQYAQEILDIYAPLANRLGIGQLKWELEDLAFRYQEPVTYKTIAGYLAQRRADREHHIQGLITSLKEKLLEVNIKAEVTGRAKHIYSIFLKAERKDVSYQEIYDHMALRILVNDIEECYSALSLVHSLWPPIMEEFDDYIAHPKPNGYRSIHTAVIGDEGKHFEIQIRTRAMHEEAERGVAAHWLYKENKSQPLDESAKLNYLRQLLDWHQELASDNEQQTKALFETQVYVFTPLGDIVDLPLGATPLDFAYHLHSELGHRCRGAKVNGHIVPLSYSLKTGDKIEIITVLQGTPSRDWLNTELGYIKTSRARSKIQHWFKQQAFAKDVELGRESLERELSRLGLTQTISLTSLAKHFHTKDEDHFLASLARGNIRLAQLLPIIQPSSQEKVQSTPITITTAKERNASSSIVGAADFLTRFSKCCKPIPGDEIIGYITQGRGISIHKKACKNIQHLIAKQRFIDIHWDKEHQDTSFSTDLKIVADENSKMINDLTALLANEKIPLLKFQSALNKNQNKIFITLTVQIKDLAQLGRLLHRIQQLPGMIEVTRE